MANKKKIGVLLSGCGVFDGAEIHESVLTLLELERNGVEPVCIAPDMEQHHVVDHTSGEEMNEKRNVLKESARIARGDIRDIKEVSANDLDGLALPGGFGAAKNFTEWAFKGPEGTIREDVKTLIQEVVRAEKPIAAVCMGPTVVAQALAGTGKEVSLTIGTTKSSSPYDIKGIIDGVNATGAKAVEKEANEAHVDETHKIATAPCYNMEATITDVHEGIRNAVGKMLQMTAVVETG